MEFLTTILAFVFALGVIIFIHEMGHLLMARAFNVRVLAFSLGFGTRLWGFKRGETDYRISLIPLGGYVKLGGEFEDEASDDPRDFVNRPRWQRILVYLAGPAMNVVLAWALVAFVFMVGIEVQPRQLPPLVGAVAPESPAAAAGLEVGDRILTVDGKAIDEWEDVQMAVITAPERALAITYTRDEQTRETMLTPIRLPRYEFGSAGFWGPGVVRVGRILEDKPAAVAGFAPGDHVLSVDGRAVATQKDFIEYIENHPDQAVEVVVERSGTNVTLTVTPEGEVGGAKIGAEIAFGFYQRYTPGKAMVESVYYNLNFVRQTFVILGKIFTREVAAKSALAGPIEIASMAGQAANQGFRDLLHLMAFISISIAIVNLLPIPILDGGQTLILIIESILRRDLSMVIKERLAQAGMVLIFALMLTVIFFDLQKQF